MFNEKFPNIQMNKRARNKAANLQNTTKWHEARRQEEEHFLKCSRAIQLRD